MTANTPTAACWYPGLQAKQSHGTSTLSTHWPSLTSLSLPVWAVQQSMPRPRNHWNTRLSQPHTSSNFWLWRLLDLYTPPIFHSYRVGLQIDRCIRRLAWNYASVNVSPVLHWGSIQGYLLRPHQIGLAPLLFLTPGSLLLRVLKTNNNDNNNKNNNSN